jgi:hypothetical protein
MPEDPLHRRTSTFHSLFVLGALLLLLVPLPKGHIPVETNLHHAALGIFAAELSDRARSVGIAVVTVHQVIA